MRILFVVPDFACGGAERVSILFAKQLKSKGIDVLFVNIGADNGEMKQWLEPILPYTSLGCQKVLYSFFKLFAIIRQNRCDYIYSSRVHVSLMLLLVGLFLKVKLIIREPTMPGNHLYKGVTQLKHNVFRFFEKRLYRRAYKLIAQTDEMKLAIMDTYHLPDSKVITIYNPIDEDLIVRQSVQTNPYTTAVNFLAVGNVCYAKAYDILIKAFVSLHEKISDAHLYVLGRYNTKYGEEIVKMAAPYKDCIHFLGFQNNPYIYMKYCSVFVLSSRQEGLPNVLLEAFYLNRPLVATRCVPIIEKIIHEGRNGYTVDVENTFALKKAMENALSLSKIQNEKWTSEYSIFDVLT